MSYAEYMNLIPCLCSVAELNALIEEAAFNDRLSDDQYDVIYHTALRRSCIC